MNVGPPPIVTNKEFAAKLLMKAYDALELRFRVVRGVGRGIGGDAACSQITLGNLVCSLQVAVM